MKREGKIQVWQDYQKEIADDHYFYARSCIRQTFFPGAEAVFIKILKDELGKDIYDNQHHTSCTGIGYHSDVVPFDTTMTVVARQFALMTEAGYENYAASCITSFGLYTEILETWHHFPEKEAQIREFLFKATGREFNKPKNLAHASDIIYKFRHQIAAKAKFKLVDKNTGKPLKVVEHIGCHYSKMFPHKGIGGAEYPYVLSGMIDAWGGEVIDYPERRHCCGFGFMKLSNPASGSGLIAIIFAPFRLASCNDDIIRGALVPGFWPITMTRSVSLKSSSRTVALPRPIDSIRATPEDSWHMFEQSGRLLVPN